MTLINISPKHIFTFNGTLINVYHANKGEGLLKHEHLQPHATICNSGSCLIRLDGRQYIIDKNHKPLNLPANKWHEIEALQDNTVFVNVFIQN